VIRQRPFQLAPERLTDKAVRTLPPYLAHGNSIFSSLVYYFGRETVRALARSLLGVELEEVGAVEIAAGHKHEQDQAAALAWWPIGTAVPWYSEGLSTHGGAVLIDQTAETDLLWYAVAMPAGASLVYPKARIGVAGATDSLALRLRWYPAGSLNSATPVEGELFGHTAQSVQNVWRELAPVNLSALAAVDGLKVAWCRVSGYVLTAGHVGRLHELTFALRQGL
jgi:hypothetical protein